MSLSTRILWALVTTILVVVSSFLVWSNYQLRNAVETLGRESQESALRFDEVLGRASVKIDDTGLALKELEKGLSKAVREDLKDHGAEVIAVTRASLTGDSRGGGRAVVVSVSPQGERPSSIPGAPPSSTVLGVAGECDREFTWELKDWRFEGTLKAVCGKEGDFHYRLRQHFELVEAEGSNGSRYLAVYELDSNGKHFGEALHVEQFAVIKKNLSPERFHVWAPHLDIAGGISNQGSVQGEIGLSLMGYGESDVDLTWRFIRGGVSYAGDGWGGVACPASYNVGAPLPLVSNIWITPCYKYDGQNGASISIGGVL